MTSDFPRDTFKLEFPTWTDTPWTSIVKGALCHGEIGDGPKISWNLTDYTTGTFVCNTNCTEDFVILITTSVLKDHGLRDSVPFILSKVVYRRDND